MYKFSINMIIFLVAFCFSLEAKTVNLKYKNKGVNFYTSSEVYSDLWRESLEGAFESYTQLMEVPEPIDIYLVETKKQSQELKIEKDGNKKLILSMEDISLKKKKATEYAVVNHELCHLWFIQTLKKAGLPQKRDPMGIPAYGHANVNDWLDESVATACETGDVAASRIMQPINPINLKDFLTQQHPVYAALKDKILAAIKNQKGQQIVLRESVDDDSLVLFYKQASFFRLFLLDKIGLDIYRDILKQIVASNDVNSFLKDKLNVNSWEQFNLEFRKYVDSYSD